VALGDRVGCLAIGGEQRLVGEDVDAPGKAARGARDAARGARREYVGAPIAGRAHAKGEVSRHFGGGERPHAEAVRDAIAQLPQRWLGERRIEFGLAEQHDLQELVPARFEVGKEPYLLERVLRHDVRLVDEDHHATAGAVELDEMLLQLAQRDAAPLRELELEIVGDRMQDLVARERRRGEIDGFHLGGQPLHEHAAEHGFAAADFARHLDDAFVMHHGIGERLERRAALGAVEEEVRVRRDAKGRLVEAEMLQVQGHAYLSSAELIRL
jgi:hypothetical protein